MKAVTVQETSDIRQTVPLSHLSVCKYRVTDEEAEDVTQLVESIRSFGLKRDLLVTPKSKDEFLIVSGHRRFWALKKLHLKLVPEMAI